MKLVVDANIFFAALIKDGVTRNIMIFDNHELFTPTIFQAEFEKYRSLFEKKLELDSEKVLSLKEKLISNSEITTVVVSQAFLDIAQRFTPDIDDAEYLALCLQLQCPLWSNDKRLKEQNVIKVFTTDELKRL